ncbi:MAG: MATE family efflux transporter [Clostridium sp.]
MHYQADIKKMNTNKNLFMMSIPIFVELMLQLLVGNVDQIMVSRVSQTSVAAIVNANQIMNLVIIVLSMAATATTVILSQYLGANDQVNISKTCMVSLVMITVVGLVSTVIVFAGYGSIYRAIRIPEEVFDEAALYLLIVGGFIVVQGLYLTFSSIIRAFAMMKEVMMVSIVMNVMNIIGNAILINGWFGLPKMGAIGAAISTDISKLVGLVLMILLFMKRTNVKLGIRYMQPFPVQILKKLCRLAIPSGVESLSYNMSQMCILGIVNSFGTLVTVTKGYCSIFANLSYVYAIALASATQIVLGYLIGSKKVDLIQKRVNATTKVALCACVGMAVLLYLGSDYIFLMFTDDPEILLLGKRVLFIEIFLEIGRAINIVMTKCLIAVGDAVTPTVVGVIFQWGVAFAGAWLFATVFHWGLEGVWIAMTIDECIRGLIYMIHFKKGRWKRMFRSVETDTL